MLNRQIGNAKTYAHHTVLVIYRSSLSNNAETARRPVDEMRPDIEIVVMTSRYAMWKGLFCIVIFLLAIMGYRVVVERAHMMACGCGLIYD